MSGFMVAVCMLFLEPHGNLARGLPDERVLRGNSVQLRVRPSCFNDQPGECTKMHLP